jgi:hypothetical protein
MISRKTPAKVGRNAGTQKGTPAAARGLPDPAHVTGVKTFTAPSGRTYEILRTDEVDEYDVDPKRASVTTRKRTKQR